LVLEDNLLIIWERKARRLWIYSRK